jgi:CheY-like chemotaxis protein
MLRIELSDRAVLAGYAQNIFHASERGAGLTKKLLSFSRHKPASSEVVDLNQLLLEALDMLKRTLTSRITINLDLEEELWTLLLDSSDLEDALLNICINAMHAIDGPGELTLRTKNKQLSNGEARKLQLKSGDYVQLTVTDTGVGMDKETKEKIFDPFYSTKGEKGTGLGLSQAYGFVRSNDGAIEVDSELGIGTVFNLYFPKNKGSNEMKTALKDYGAENLEGRESILVVDDEVTLLDVASTILSKWGYDVTCAQNGELALEVLRSKPVDLILSDVVMPKMTGYELANIVREKYPLTKIQLISGYNEVMGSQVEDATLLENQILKPYDAKTLLMKIRTLLDS